MANIIRDRDKLKALTHYIIARCEDPRILGSIKLNKILWASDLWAYVHWGKPITGEHYIKQQFGPVAGTVGLINELQAEEKIVVRKRRGRWQKQDGLHRPSGTEEYLRTVYC